MQKIKCIYFVYILYLPLQRTVALIYVYILFNALTTAVLGATNRAQQYEWIMQDFMCKTLHKILPTISKTQVKL